MTTLHIADQRGTENNIADLVNLFRKKTLKRAY